ncbi:hypothetical protein FN846DRAFT_481043 [Sphaerosporella brunnea]|uniref:deoxyribose-phosphate aldolase n=1 Tax=Sphaerosporella brunnea TaxID=1250544 RepID=A0A5J5FAN9_9PEZI|nr:hypothetical protein FN846DRAFT_481043 [Sphaerosporella brunnea]
MSTTPRDNASWHTFLGDKTNTILTSAPLAAVPLPGSFAGSIDHTLLSPSATRAQIAALCSAAKTHGFASVCVNGSHAAAATAALVGSGVKTCVVVGFPLGACSAAAKAYEAAQAVKDGATEVDSVLPIGLLKGADYVAVFDDVKAVVDAATPWPVKIIIETALLSEEEKVHACIIAAEAGAAFVKTCTGFSGGGATVEDVRLMRRAVEGYVWSGEGYEGAVRVKASGGVRDWEAARNMLEAGASRIGTSSGIAIMEGGRGEGY